MMRVNDPDLRDSPVKRCGIYKCPVNTSLISTPRPISSSRAAPMSETIRYSPWATPGAAAVTLPKMTEHPDQAA